MIHWRRKGKWNSRTFVFIILCFLVVPIISVQVLEIWQEIEHLLPIILCVCHLAVKQVKALEISKVLLKRGRKFNMWTFSEILFSKVSGVKQVKALEISKVLLKRGRKIYMWEQNSGLCWKKFQVLPYRRGKMNIRRNWLFDHPYVKAFEMIFGLEKRQY